MSHPVSADFTTCDLYDDYLDAARVALPVFQHFGGRKKFSGLAVTVKCFEDNSRIKELAGTDGRGKVMMVDAGGSIRCAVLGDMIAGDAQKNGWEGVVIYGCVRDRVALAGLDIGVMALGTLPRKSSRRGEGTVNIPVTLANILCNPDDRVFADEDGILLLDPA
ncbi:MAG: ribonuclease E activity regulator RraA [Pseudomonadota bacterium]